ncbi:MAG: hypothetical protein PHO10_10245 [Gemmiger sp.]|nr:hypothetical protein [Gemmiger sp.]
MSLFRRLLPVAVGAAAGCAAVLLLQRYNQDYAHMEGLAAVETEAEAPKPVPVPQPTAPIHREAQQPGHPNVNPVADVTEKPPLVDGKVDVTKIAAPEDFADWDDLGCQG